MAGIKIVDLPPLGRDLASTDLLELSLAGGTGSRKITGQEIMNTSKLNIGTTAIISGTVGRVLFQGTGNVLQQSSSLFWDNTNGTLEATTTADNLFGLRLKSITGQLRIKPFLNATYGVLLESKNIADSAYLPMSYSSSKHLFLDGNVIINSTSDSGFKLDVNGTGRFQNGIVVTNPSFTGQGSIAQTADNTTVITGRIAGATENIVFGPTNRIFINASQTRFPIGSIQIASTLTVGNSGNTSTVNMLYLTGGITASSAIARGGFIDTTLTASANNDTLIGLDINPTFALGAFTGTSRIGARIQNSRFLITGTYSSLSSEVANPDSLVQLDATINGRASSRVIAFRINPTINAANTVNQVFAALEVTPTFQNVGLGASAYAINSSGPNNLGTQNILGSQTYFLGQGGTSTYHYVGTIPNGQGFRVQVNSNISGYSYNFDGSGIPTYTLRNNNIDALQIKSTGNILINTTTDAGFKLDVNGSTRIKGAGTTVATLSLDVQNSSGTSSVTCYDDLSVYINGKNTSGYTTNIRIGGQSNQANISFFGNNNIYVGQGGSVENIPSALIAMGSTTKGFLPPRMTQTQRDAIASPVIGLEIYQTDATEGKYIYKSSGWTYIG